MRLLQKSHFAMLSEFQYFVFLILDLQKLKFIILNILFKKKIIYLPECSSTNTYALNKVKLRELEEGSIIITDNQTAGRGQINNKWESEPYKNINISIVLQPYFIDPKDVFILSMLISNSIHKTLVKYLDSRLKVKWPNDIYFNNKKLVGILIENIIIGNKIKASVIGIGINVNQRKFNCKKATSILLECNKNIDLKILRDDLLYNIFSDYNILKLEINKSEIKSFYINNLYRKIGSYLFRDKKGIFRGTIKDIDEIGRLIILDLEGNVRSYIPKEVKFQ